MIKKNNKRSIIYFCNLPVIPLLMLYAARHKTNTNYENLMSDKVETRVAKNLLFDWCWSSSWVKKVF